MFQRYTSDVDSPWQNATNERPTLLSAMACTQDEQQMNRLEQSLFVSWRYSICEEN